MNHSAHRDNWTAGEPVRKSRAARLQWSNHAAFDVVGVGLNATDTIAVVSRFPAYAGKAPILKEVLAPGGQVASALAPAPDWACGPNISARWATTSAAAFRCKAWRKPAWTLPDVKVRPNCATQLAYIVVDASTGERTVFWRRDPACESTRRRLRKSRSSADACCTSTVTIRRRWRAPPPSPARTAFRSRWTWTPFTPDLKMCFRTPITWWPARSFLRPGRDWPIPSQALEKLQEEYGMKLAAMTLGAHGSLARYEGRFVYSPAYMVDAIDTTGAGDVFHGAFCYAVLEGMPMLRALEFSNAMAALNCTALGARGGIRGLEEIGALMAGGRRRSLPELAARAAVPRSERMLAHSNAFPVRVTQRSYSRPVVTVALIVVNVMVFLHEFSLDRYSLNYFIGLYSLRARPTFTSRISSRTCSFMRAGFICWATCCSCGCSAKTSKTFWGTGSFCAFYLLCGVAAAAVQMAADPFSRVPMLGASGAIAGVMGAYLVKFPRSRVEMIFFAILLFHFTVPAWFMLAYWFALQVLGSVSGMTEASAGRHGVLRPRGRLSGGHRVGPRNGRARALLAPARSVLVMENMALDVLAIAAHPDDIEQTCGGALIRTAEAGYRTGALDLTAGDMGTRGTPEERIAESEAAAKHMLLRLARKPAHAGREAGKQHRGAHEPGGEDPRAAAARGDSAVLAGAPPGPLPRLRNGIRSLFPGGPEEARRADRAAPSRRRSSTPASTPTSSLRSSWISARSSSAAWRRC